MKHLKTFESLVGKSTIPLNINDEKHIFDIISMDRHNAGIQYRIYLECDQGINVTINYDSSTKEIDVEEYTSDTKPNITDETLSKVQKHTK